QAFVTTFLNRTIRAHAEDQQSASAHGSSQGQDSDESVVAVPNLKQGLGKVMPRWKHSRRRIVFVDLEGTLWKRDLSREGLVRMEEDYKRARSPAQLGLIQDDKKEEVDTTVMEEAKEEEVIMPPEDVLQVLERLVADGRNEVWLLSGLRVRGLLERIAKRMPRLGIVAENGCFIKTIQGPPPSSSTQGVGIPKVKVGRMSSFSAGMSVSPPRLNNAQQTTQQKNERGGEWLNMVANFNLSWKSACLEILHYFAERTPGSFIEERDASIVFRFWTGAMPVEGTAEDPDRTWARRQAAEAQNHIFDSLGERYGLRIIPGKNSFLFQCMMLPKLPSIAKLFRQFRDFVFYPRAPYIPELPEGDDDYYPETVADLGFYNTALLQRYGSSKAALAGTFRTVIAYKNPRSGHEYLVIVGSRSRHTFKLIYERFCQRKGGSETTGFTPVDRVTFPYQVPRDKGDIRVWTARLKTPLPFYISVLIALAIHTTFRHLRIERQNSVFFNHLYLQVLKRYVGGDKHIKVTQAQKAGTEGSIEMISQQVLEEIEVADTFELFEGKIRLYKRAVRYLALFPRARIPDASL
ncbi:hypothetical protein H0H93_003934, partial [Arthromyces matolae]